MNVRPLLRAALALSTAAAAIVLQASCAHSVTTEDTGEATLFSPDSGGATGNQCVQRECPKPWATCPGSNGLCTTDTSRDARNCGACANVCPRPAYVMHASALCAGAKCELACNELYADCNTTMTDGCETATATDPKNCGACGITCKEGELCWRGACGCPNGYTQCGTECLKLDSDIDNCGSCGSLCRAPASNTDPAWTCGPGVTPPHTGWTCATAACKLLCKPGFGDCNDAFCSDGCEIDLASDPLNCGTCGHACTAGQTCGGGTCLCPEGTTRCGDRCVDLAVDPLNCGSCGMRCPGPRAGTTSGGGSPGCTGGTCTYVCFPGYADCDDVVYNGCEANLSNDQLHCGSCTTKCNVQAGQPCVTGQCLTRECDAGVVF